MTHVFIADERADASSTQNVRVENLMREEKIDEILRIVRQLASGGFVRSSPEIFNSSMLPVRSLENYFEFEKKISNDADFKAEVVSE